MSDTQIIRPSTDDPEGTYLIEGAEEKIKQMLADRTRGPRNRKERRQLMKKMGKDNYQQLQAVTDTAKKLNYVTLIEKLRELNKKKENENYDEQATED